MLRKKQRYEKKKRKLFLTFSRRRNFELKYDSFINRRLGTALQRITLLEILQPVKVKILPSGCTDSDRVPETFVKMRKIVTAARIAAEQFLQQNGEDRRKIACPEEAKIGLMEVLETTQLEKEAEPIFPEQMQNNGLKKLRLYTLAENGGTVHPYFTGEEYKTICETKKESLYHLITSAIYFPLEIRGRANPSTLEMYKNQSCSERIIRYLSAPLDWTIALYNFLCYHLRVYTKRRSELNEWNNILFLCVCVCEVLNDILKELEDHGF